MRQTDDSGRFSFKTKCKKRMFGHILHFEKPVEFCRLYKVVLEVFLTFVSYLIGSTVFADFQCCIGLPRLFKLCKLFVIIY